MTEPVIQVEGLHFSYGGHPVLEGVDFEVEAGDFVGIMGPNGGGKTTLFKVLLGLLKPQRGRARVLGHRPGKAAARLGYVPQQTEPDRDFPISAQDVVLMGRISRRAGRRWSPADREAARRALERVGMWAERNRLIGRLSGGERQRVLIARALAADPEILFLDEPTASVDPLWQTQLYDLLRELNQRMTILVVSHDLTVLSSHIRSVACINRRLIHHHSAEITTEMLEMAYPCPVELVAHGLPHRVLAAHSHEDEDDA